MTSIALFGTSADPPTYGHQAIVAWLAQRFDRVAVWAADNPFKSHRAPLDCRTEMLRVLVETIEPRSTHVQVCPDLSHPRTVVVLERARERWPDATLSLVIGSDLVAQLPRWYRSADIVQQARLLVIPRPGYPVEPADLDRLTALGATIELADLSGPAGSSSAYREAGDRHSIPPAIEAYIRGEQLYLWQNVG
jgi:nicotinate-nucleotide adenylyltransferase